LEFTVPGTLEYKTNSLGNLNVLTITGGFSPGRVKSFRVNEVNSVAAQGNQLSLVDEGKVRELLRGMTIEVECLTKQSASGVIVSDDYQKRHSVTFDIPPINTPSVGAIVNNNVYQLDMQRFFGAWLRPGYDVQYVIKIAQTTKSGTVYQQSESLQFQVPKL
jgi:hypothetical protein